MKPACSRPVRTKPRYRNRIATLLKKKTPAGKDKRTGRTAREYLYINACHSKRFIRYTGLEFWEFMRSVPSGVDRLLLLEPTVYTGDRSKTGFVAMENERFEQLLHEDVHAYGNFTWVDYDKREHVEQLQPVEIAELLYLMHMGQPLNSPFIDRIKNRFVYLAHDDGWYGKLYCRTFEDFGEIVAGKIRFMVQCASGADCVVLPTVLQNELLDLSKDGLMMDFQNLRSGEEMGIPLYLLGDIADADGMMNKYRQLKHEGKPFGRIIYANGCWTIEEG